jgi:hypothetical protein
LRAKRSNLDPPETPSVRPNSAAVRSDFLVFRTREKSRLLQRPLEREGTSCQRRGGPSRRREMEPSTPDDIRRQIRHQPRTLGGNA